MRARNFLVAALLAALVPCASGQYATFPALGTFAPIGALPGAVLLAGVSSCDDCTEVVTLPFTFPWYGGALNVTQVNVSSNGSINLGPGAAASLCCSAWALDNGQAGGTPVPGQQVARIDVLQEDLDPAGTGGNIYALSLGTSFIISYESVSFYPGPASGSVNAQVELFVTGDIEIRIGTVTGPATDNLACGLTDPGGGVTGWFSPASVIPQFNSVGQTSGGVFPQNTGVLFVAGAMPQWQMNSPEADLAVNGVAASGPFGSPAGTTVCLGQSATLTAASTLGPNLWEMGIVSGPLLPSALTTGNGQTINLDMPNVTYFWGGATPNLSPFFPLSAPVTLPVLASASAQMGVVDPGHPDGMSLSQGVQLDVGIGVTGPILGPIGDDSTIEIAFGPGAGCTPAFFPFYGTLYSSCFVSSNGRIMFGGGNTAFSPSIAGALTQEPEVGAWTDLNPASGGTISTIYNAATSQLVTSWVSVPYFPNTGSNSFDITLDFSSGTVSLDNLGGLGVAAGSVFMGVSGGSAVGATDPGNAPFAATTVGVSLNATDMVYNLGPRGTTQGGAGQIFFMPNGFGNYDWIAF